MTACWRPGSDSSCRPLACASDGPREHDQLIDFVVVAFRSESHLPSCLDAIAADQPHGARIIVVDNASPDQSVEVARNHPSAPRVIRSSRNLGFGGACNLALA